MSQVTFYLLPEETQPNNTESPAESPIAAHIDFACRLTAQLYRENKKVFIFTDNQQQAEAVDEHLWQFEPDSFVAHNLQGEGPKFGTPVEIGCQAPRSGRPILINLSQHMPDFVGRFNQTFDFVPAEEKLKQQARERYKQYRAAGHQLSTQPAA
ncbi:DNA polymerase III subunit chi [Saccharobesus litoralis]|uniref:DNA polymerase III subunit chi n=1 Tax=Saccharobesus litoralis TaxID=2172099 RepID=A0A2S0VVM6_9ALTE|nr:DNA polymerase III subunit chi [Saccharobesus litoralis]AWB68245.1 DNA polymerase III subunit chi [Saccharobesus litoralis]